MFKGFVGLGILALPYGFSKSGWIGGILFFLLFGLIILYLSIIMVQVADKKKFECQNFSDFCQKVFGESIQIYIGFLVFLL